MLEETWAKTNDANVSPDEIKKELVREVCLPNFQFKNPFEVYDNILGYSDFSIQEQVPPKIQLIPSERLTKFLIKQGYERLN